MSITDEDVQAYVDGALSPHDAARVDAAMAADVLVAARVERERRRRVQVRGTFDPSLAKQMPAGPDRPLDGLRASGHDADAGASDVVAMSGRPGAQTRHRRWRVAAFGVAAAVTALALGTWGRVPRGDVVVHGDVLFAHGGLARRLDGAPDAASPVAIGQTFRDRAGDVCRTFVADGAGIAGIACRDDDVWRLDVLTRTAGSPRLRLHGPSDAMPPEIRTAVEARRQGAVFDAAQERTAQANGWR